MTNQNETDQNEKLLTNVAFKAARIIDTAEEIHRAALPYSWPSGKLIWPSGEAIEDIEQLYDHLWECRNKLEDKLQILTTALNALPRKH